ncbi:hypothetical protein LAZ67_3004816 [Cordylochernes scorpioides]|uniref:Uncharacterized protein n=1 Tax=Cordylochernes scorpioides TaxID=51811 RepID=A0ABY6KAU6_9ARAC|nr:hypothetical protein LAZ67_3004816 [Cordylochernes scorpioides]
MKSRFYRSCGAGDMEELVKNEKTPAVDYPSGDSDDGQIRTRSGRIVKPNEPSALRNEAQLYHVRKTVVSRLPQSSTSGHMRLKYVKGDQSGFVALTRKQRHLATEIGLGLPHPVERMDSSGRRPDGQSKYPPTNQGRVGDTAVPSRQEKKPRGSLPKMTSGNFVHLP